MSSEATSGLVMATVLWAVAVVAVVGGPTKPPSEVWLVSASDKVPSHPTLVRASGTRFVTGPKGNQEASATRRNPAL
jgi:hypothetical protein